MEPCWGSSSSTATPSDAGSKPKRAQAVPTEGPVKYFADRSECPRVKTRGGARKEFPHIDQALALLKYTVAREDMWPTHQGSIHPRVRKGVLEALNDHNMVLEYSAPLKPKSHFKGKKVVAAQAVNGNLIRLSAWAGDDVESLASTILHEMVHIWQIRTQGGTGGEMSAYRAEANLPKKFFRGKAKDKNFCGKKKTKKPRKRSGKVSDKPPGDKPFGVFLVGDNLFMGNWWSIKDRATCTVGGWGLDCEKKVAEVGRLEPVLGWFETPQGAVDAYCEDVVPNTYRKQPLVPSGHYYEFEFDGKAHNVVGIEGWCTVCKEPGVYRPSAQCGEFPLGTLQHQ